MYRTKRTYRAISGGYQRRGAPTRRRRLAVRAGLRPSYRGWNPRQFVRGEWKFLDSSINQDINTTAVLTLVNGLQPGNSASQRIGMKVSIKSMEIRLNVNVTPATGVSQVNRWFILLDRQANGAAPAAVTDYLVAQSSTAPRQLANRKRFKLITDKIYRLGGVLNGAGTGAQVAEGRMFKMYIKFRRPIIVEYNAGVAGTIADISSNSLFFGTFGTEAPGNTDTNCTGYVRIRYTDL